MVFDHLYADRAKLMKTSEIREFFKLTEQPDVMSFAGGFPSAEFFPMDKVNEVMQDLIREEGKCALQYGPTEGNQELREYLAQKMTNEGIPADEDHILITNGSQQGMDLLSKVFINPGDLVLVEEPGYVGGLGAIFNYQGDRHPIPLDEDGINIDILTSRLRKMKMEGRTPKFAYVVPNFQNPTGICMSLERRKQLLELAKEYNFLIIEDNPYGEIRFEGEPVQSIKSMDTEGRVIYLGSFSKTFIPGIRVGWIVGEPELIQKIASAKQATDLCSNSLGQRMACRFASSGYIEKHVASLISRYKAKRDLMLSCMEKHFPAGVKWTRPEGGFFIWVTLPEGMNARDVLLKAIERKVAFVDGAGFFVNGNGKNTGRFAFSEACPDKIRCGISILGEIMHEEMQAYKKVRSA
ncbi:aminotransferase-like domain-containing protein [Dethiobacter alkaliphilus]|uniref:aminotransferase-like domain-containing protein n=1 Tax=Dethiobacter alkaliphilus TaxID=427926 RepID=UPI002226BD69|nr:PLP-dependent aminotransferase family protein [Dethiobacter alkaliphilus]MCW3488704.1 PLP-dependent aminotransferase family protein [Dethiobacter alkaliphilus]